MRPWEMLKFGFSKMHILRILREMYRKNEPKPMVKIACIWQQIDIYFRNFSTVMDISKQLVFKRQIVYNSFAFCHCAHSR